MSIKRCQAFTLLEVLVALGIVALVSVFIIGMFAQALRVSQKSKNMTIATFLAEKKLEETLSTGSPSVNAVETGDFNGDFAQFHYTLGFADYRAGTRGLKLVSLDVFGPSGSKAHLDSLMPKHHVAIACGGYHSLALRGDATVWTFGYNSHGQLGNNEGNAESYSAIPVSVCEEPSGERGHCFTELGGMVDLAGGLYFSLALKEDGTVWAFGQNHDGQLGDGTTSDHLTRVEVANCKGCIGQFLTNVIAIAASKQNGFSLALKKDGTVWGWGNNMFGQLGDNQSGAMGNHSLPTQVCLSPGAISGSCKSNLTDVIAISAGASHSLALKRDGTVWAWGNNSFSQLGDAPGDSSVPIAICQTHDSASRNCVHFLDEVTALAAGGKHSLVLKRDGTVWAWGSNEFGQIGGRLENSATPVQICQNEIPDSQVCAHYLDQVIAIAAGNSHSLALKRDGTVWAWGNNNFGQVCNIQNLQQPSTSLPIEICEIPGATPGSCKSTLMNVIAISAGNFHSLALKGDESIRGWGNNGFGQLGNGVPVSRQAVPVEARRLSADALR